MFKSIWKNRTQKMNASAVSDEVISPRFPKRRQGCVKFVVCENETNDFTRLEIGIRDVDDTQWLADKLTPKAGNKYWTTDEIPIMQGEQIVARFTGATVNDILTLTVRGWMWTLPPDVFCEVVS